MGTLIYSMKASLECSKNVARNAIVLFIKINVVHTVPFKSKLTVICESRFSIPVRIENLLLRIENLLTRIENF